MEGDEERPDGFMQPRGLELVLRVSTASDPGESGWHSAEVQWS
jgi:hypothetical protein